MKSIYSNDPTPAVFRLALKPAEAAASLGVSEKTLWSNTRPQGTIPCVRLGSRVMYYVHQLREWADKEAARQEAEQQAGGFGVSE